MWKRGLPRRRLRVVEPLQDGRRLAGFRGGRRLGSVSLPRAIAGRRTPTGPERDGEDRDEGRDRRSRRIHLARAAAILRARCGTAPRRGRARALGRDRPRSDDLRLGARRSQPRRTAELRRRISCAHAWTARTGNAGRSRTRNRASCSSRRRRQSGPGHPTSPSGRNGRGGANAGREDRPRVSHPVRLQAVEPGGELAGDLAAGRARASASSEASQQRPPGRGRRRRRGPPPGTPRSGRPEASRRRPGRARRTRRT